MRRETPLARTSDPLVDALAAINPDELTPREALEALYRLKELGRE
jgi:DNA mismatch repair protein MutS